MKGLLKRSNDPYLALLAIDGRALRTTIPIHLEQLQPKLPNSKELRKKDKEMKIKKEENYDKRQDIRTTYFRTWR